MNLADYDQELYFLEACEREQLRQAEEENHIFSCTFCGNTYDDREEDHSEACPR